jgi:hypothetical protein
MLRQRFGRLIVVWEAPPSYSSGRMRRMWVCRCDCGTVVEAVHQSALRSGETRSCGCLSREVASHRMWGRQINADDILAEEAAERAIEGRKLEAWLGRIARTEGSGGSLLPLGVPAVSEQRADDAGSPRLHDEDVPRNARASAAAVWHHGD